MSQPTPATTTTPGDEEQWETQTTRKQRKKQQKEQEAANAATATSSSSSASATSGVDAEAAVPVVAASDSSFPITVDATGDDATMESDFMQAGFIGLDGKQIPPGATLVQPPPQTASSAPLRKPRFDENQLPKCFVCQTRHEMDQCRKKEKL